MQVNSLKSQKIILDKLRWGGVVSAALRLNAFHISQRNAVYRRRALISAAVLFVLIASILSANITQIVVEPAAPIVVGYEVTFTIMNSLPAELWSHQSRCLTDPPSDWSPDPALEVTSNVSWAIVARVGSRQFRGGAQENTSNDPMQPNLVWSYLIKDFSAVGPDHDVFNGPYVSHVVDDMTGLIELDYYFDVKAGDVLIGPYAAAWLEVRIRRPSIDQDSGWMDEAPGEREYNCGTIWRNVEGNFNDFASNDIYDVVDDFYQQNRIRIKDCAGYDNYFTFSERHFQLVKSGYDQVTLVDVTQ